MSKTLYRTYRPRTFSEIIGQEHIITTLTNAILRDRIAHAYLFTGGRGTGKTTTARLFAQAVNCMERDGFTVASADTCAALASGASPDLIEIDAASHTGVDNIRDLRETVVLAPHTSAYKVYIIDEVHMLSTGAFNALLKTLEEPPSHAIFILATTDIHKVPDTIISRCQRFDFTRLSIPHITQKIHAIVKAEKATITSEAAELIAIAADGAMRDAESILAQVIALEDATITAVEVSQILGLSARVDIFTLIDAYVACQTDQAITLISGVVQSGYDLHAFTRALVTTLRSFLFLSLDSTKDADTLLAITTEEKARLLSLVEKITPEEIMLMIRLTEEARLKMNTSTIQSLPLELASIEICRRSMGKKEVTASSEMPAKDDMKKAVTKPSPPKTESAQPSKSAVTPQEKQSTSPVAETIAKNQKDVPLTVKVITQKWDDVVSAAQNENASLSGLLKSSVPILLEENRLTLRVSYALHRDKLLDPKTLLTLQNVLATIFTTPLRVSIDVEERKPVSPQDANVLLHAQNLLGGEIIAS